MAATVEELREAIEEALAPGFRGRLLAQGQARSIIWRDGVLPPGAPAFSPTLTYDLLSFGFSLLGIGLRLRELERDHDLCSRAFEQAASAIESVVSRGDEQDSRRGFFRIASAASYHLGNYSARSYSMLETSLQGSNLSLAERGLALLILRKLGSLMKEIHHWRAVILRDDEEILSSLSELREQSSADERAEDLDEYEVIDRALTDCFLGALATYLAAMEFADSRLVESALNDLQTGLEVCAELNLVPQWWVHRLTIHLLDDLWSSTYHVVLPIEPPTGDAPEWRSLRRLFVSLLVKRDRAEIDLWPSQIEGARRAVDESDDLVVSMPTSAGKTRIAELCILRCLSQGKRTVFVTPLRALSAQTEVSLRRTFLPLGKTVSTLYGGIGTSGIDRDVLKSSDIVVATPEKLDFALRNDPTIIDDVGLVVLDEGHMIGMGEREVRYEVQIQRLLRRDDANQRRMVCLSAVLPKGEELNDFVCWLQRDSGTGAIEVEWRPTRLRYGEVTWESSRGRARLSLLAGEEESFVPNYFGKKKPTSEMRRTSSVGRRRNDFPNDQAELVLATSWKLVEEGQSVLIYCPERRSVEPYAKRIVDLYQRGLVDSVLEIGIDDIVSATSLGEEWLGEGHPIVDCLKIGVAIHHGALPTPFRREIEKLLRDGVLRVTVSSPTLSQGLNLSATTIVMSDIEHYDMTLGKRRLIRPSQFHNIVGRAGRAFVDIEGLILYPMFDRIANRRSNWQKVISDEYARKIESGLLQVVVALLMRLGQMLGISALDELVEYVFNNAEAWSFRGLESEDEDKQKSEREGWRINLASLDTAILSLLDEGDKDIEISEIASTLDAALKASLWQRRLARFKERDRDLLNRSLEARALHVWSQTFSAQRRGYFLAGVGYETGQRLDAVAEQANDLLVQANSAIAAGYSETAISSISALAELLFEIPPFIPEPFPENWREILSAWLSGGSLSEFTEGNATKVLQFVEGGLTYRLTWGMEAIRVRAVANGDKIQIPFTDAGLSVGDFDLSLVGPAVECGTLNVSAALLIQAGFASRLAAIKVIQETDAAFASKSELSLWLKSEIVLSLSSGPNWPTPETAGQWREFVEGFDPNTEETWKERAFRCGVSWDGAPPSVGAPVRLVLGEQGSTLVHSPDARELGRLPNGLASEPRGLMLARVGQSVDELDVTYIGPEDVQFSDALD